MQNTRKIEYVFTISSLKRNPSYCDRENKQKKWISVFTSNMKPTLIRTFTALLQLGLCFTICLFSQRSSLNAGIFRTAMLDKSGTPIGNVCYLLAFVSKPCMIHTIGFISNKPTF